MLEMYCIMKFFAYMYIFCFQRQAKVWRTMFIEAMLRVSGQSCVWLFFKCSYLFTIAYQCSNTSSDLTIRSEAIQITTKGEVLKILCLACMLNDYCAGHYCRVDLPWGSTSTSKLYFFNLFPPSFSSFNKNCFAKTCPSLLKIG